MDSSDNGLASEGDQGPVWEHVGMEEVGGYRLLSRIGAGGMGVVYHAVDADGRDVAVKVLHPQIAADPSARARLAREVDLMHRVRGEGVARVLDAEVDDEVAFVVTELIDGPTLEDLIHEIGHLEQDELADLAHGLASALRAIHRAGVVHRDLKPGNVMMSADGPVLIDFGIAQVVDDSRLTQTGMVTGTPGFLDPELVDGAQPSPTADWWAWAAVLVFAATGRRPFGTGPTAAVLARMSRGDVDVDGLDPLVADALRAALTPNSAERLQPDDVLAVLDGDWGSEDLTVALAALAPATTRLDSGPPDAGRTTILGSGDDPPADPYGPIDIPGGYSTQVLPPRGAPATAPPYGAPSTRVLDVDHAGRPYGSPSGHPGSPLTQATPPGAVPGWEVPPWLRPAPSRAGLVAALAVLLAAVAGLWPGLAFLALAVLMVVAGALGLGDRQTRSARLRRGKRRGDGARQALMFPVNLIGGAAYALFPLTLAAAIGWVAYRGLAIAVGYGQLPPELELYAPAWGAGVAALLTAWVTPGAGVAREGARVGLTSMFPTPGFRAFFAVLTLALAVLAVAFIISSGATELHWEPLPPLPAS